MHANPSSQPIFVPGSFRNFRSGNEICETDFFTFTDGKPVDWKPLWNKGEQKVKWKWTDLTMADKLSKWALLCSLLKKWSICGILSFLFSVHHWESYQPVPQYFRSLALLTSGKNNSSCHKWCHTDVISCVVLTLLILSPGKELVCALPKMYCLWPYWRYVKIVYPQPGKPAAVLCRTHVILSVYHHQELLYWPGAMTTFSLSVRRP